MTVKEYLESTFSDNEYNIRARIECNDGYSISVQGGTRHHYCSPRNHCNEYHEVELGFPSELDSLIEEYAGDKSTTETVFPYVPIDIVEQLITKHGGIK